LFLLTGASTREACGRLGGPAVDEHERVGQRSGHHRHPLPQIPRPAADRARDPEEQRRLHHPLDGGLVLQLLGRGEAARWTQAGALGGHHQRD